MHYKRMVFFTMLILFSLLIAPAGTAQAQDSDPYCPPHGSGLLREKEFLQSLPVECIKAYKEAVHQASAVASAQDVGPMSSGGPDGFGYTYYDTAYNWISASTNSGLTGDDEFTGPINIGFDFPFYGIPQSQLYFSTNGLITFGAGSWDWGEYGLPSEIQPNNLIAPYGDDLVVGSPYNSGAIYYSQGGTTPNRYFVVEWRNVSTYDGSSAFSFEVILHEDGDIIFQHQSLPTSCCGTVIAGIEDGNGHDGQTYLFHDLSVPKAARFYYPAPAAHMMVSPLVTGQFAAIGGHVDFTLTITNNGGLGPDTYDFTSISPWPATLYASNGVTALTDTDADTKIDTGPILPATSMNVIVRVDTLAGAKIGDTNTGEFTITSTLNTSVTKDVRLTTTIPANFANVFQDGSDGAMSLLTARSDAIHRTKVTADAYYGYDVAVMRLPNGNYFYAWAKSYFNGSSWVADIEYTLLSRTGSIIRPVTKLTNHAGATNSIDDSEPSIAIAPDGTVGVAWSRYIYDQAAGQSNSNVYMAVLNSSGILLSGPTNITNNSLWDDGTTPNVPYYFDLSIAASDDYRFVISWVNETIYSEMKSYGEIWYAVRNIDGTSAFAPKVLIPGGSLNRSPVLNSLKNGKVILTWAAYVHNPYYAVIGSDGSIAKAMTPLGTRTHFFSTDAVQLPNGKVAAVWGDELTMQFGILNSSFTMESLSTIEYYASALPGDFLSVTTDDSSHVIMTWGSANEQYYALGDNAGTFITTPVMYRTSRDGIEISRNGQGNAPYESLSQPLAVISGNTVVGGVVLGYTDGTPQFVISDSGGNYSIYVSVGWSGTVTPSKPGFTFTPASRTYSNIQTDQASQDYTAQGLVKGADTTGVFRPINGILFLKNTHNSGFADVGLNYGIPGDYPVVGDWDGNGTATIGVYRNGSFYLRNANTIGFADIVFAFGQSGDQPVAGDWDGDGIDTIGVYRPSNGQFMLRNSNDAGAADISFYLGNVGDVGIAGDWDGDGKDTTGVFRPINGILFLKNANDTGFADVALNYGIPGDRPVTGDWDNDGDDTIGVYRNGRFYLRNENTIGFADIVFDLGNPGDMPIAGDWDGAQ